MATCEERIDEQMESAMARLREALRDEEIVEVYALECESCGHKWQSEDEFEDCLECNSEDVLADPVDQEERETRDSYMEDVLWFGKRFEVWRVELSCGGPQDYIDLFVDPEDHVIDHAIYHFLDWFDGAQRYVGGDDLENVRAMFEAYVQE